MMSSTVISLPPTRAEVFRAMSSTCALVCAGVQEASPTDGLATVALVGRALRDRPGRTHLACIAGGVSFSSQLAVISVKRRAIRQRAAWPGPVPIDNLEKHSPPEHLRTRDQPRALSIRGFDDSSAPTKNAAAGLRSATAFLAHVTTRRSS